MRISESWLRQFVNPPITTQTLAEQLTMAGLEVSSVEPAAAEFDQVVVGEVIAVKQHPNADKLNVCRVCVVADNASEPLQIICGANNVKVGLKAPVALVGATLPGAFKIKQAKLRGTLSLGMLCSKQELGLAKNADGLLELPDDAPIGTDIRDYLALNDNIIELDLTPNRADCLSLEGIAREVGVLNKMDWTPVEFTPAVVTHDAMLAVSVKAKKACPKYLGRLIKNINPNAQTPDWMQERLRRSGIGSLGPLVDVTNYVLLELGQPLHAFDADKLSGAISVRMGSKGEQLALLNEQIINLDESALVIADDKQALALAGIMGGKNTAVGEHTTTVFLESAFFTPSAIAGKARQFGLHTDSSHRFERGVDFTLQQRAIERATQLIVDISGGSVGPICSATTNATLPSQQTVTLRRQQVKRVLGISVADAYIEQIFNGLDMQVETQNEQWRITPPSCRFDIAIEADLLEEIGRIYGYNKLPKGRLLMHSKLGQAAEKQLPLARIEDLLVDKGYQEVISYSFVDEAMQNMLAPDAQCIRIKNPIAAELSVMRTTLWCGLLNTALYNTNRQQNRVRLFETGLRFVVENQTTVQQKMLSGLALGTAFSEQWAEPSRNVDFFDLKGDLSAIYHLNNCTVHYQKTTHPALHPGQSAKILNQQGTTIGVMGMLHPSLEKQLGFDAQVFLFELEQEPIFSKPIPHFEMLSKFPSLRRDMALLVAETVSASALIDCIYSNHEKSIKKVLIFDIYQGEGVAAGYKSVALSLTLQHATQTLTEAKIDGILTRVLETLKTNINVQLRE